MDKFELNPYSGRSSEGQTPEKTTSRMKQLQREVNHFRDLVNKKDEQIEYLSSRNNQLLLTKSGAASKKQSDSIYEASLQDQINRLNSKLNDKVKQYERLYQKHSTLQNDLATLEDFAADLDRERKFLADKLAHIEIHTEGDEVVGELENKLVLMSTEIMRLGQLARNKNQQNNDLRFKVKSQEQELEQIQNQLSEKEKTLNQYRERLRNLQKKQLELQSTKEYQNQSTYKILSLEIQRLNVLLHNKIQEIGTLEHRNKVLQDRIHLSNSNVDKRNYGQLEIQLQRLNMVNMSNKQDIESLENEVKKIRRENKDIGDQNEKCRRTIKKLEEELEETRRSYIKNQNEKIKIQVETSERTIREQRSTIQKLQKQAQVFNEEKEQQMKTRFEEEVNKLKTILQKSESKCTSLCNDLMRYEEKLVMLSQQVERLSLQNGKYQQQNAELKRLQYKIETKERELKEIERTRESAFAQMKRDKNEIDRLKIQVKQLWEKNRDLESKQYQLRSLSEQFQMITQKLNNKQRQCKILQQKVEEVGLRSSGARVKNLESQLQSQRKAFRLKQEQASYNFEKQIQTFKDTVAKLTRRVNELSSEQFSSESNYAILAQQIRRLNQVLSESSQTILNQKRQINLLESNLQTAQMSLQRIKSNQYTNEKVEQQIQRRCQIYNKEVALHSQENSSLKSKVQELSTNNTMLEHQIHTTKLNLQDLRQALKNKQLELKQLMEDVRSKKKNEDSLLMLIKEIKQSNLRLERKLADIEQDYIRRLEEKSAQKQQLEKEYIQYNRKVREAESEATNLKFELASLQNRLEMLSRQQRELETQNQRLQAKLDGELRDKANAIKIFNEQHQQKISGYERELKKNAKALGELEADNSNKNHHISRLEGTIRQLEQEKYRMQDQNRQIESDRRRDLQIKSQEARYSLEQKQVELSNLRQQMVSLQQQIRNKDQAIQSKSQLIFEYENKLAMLSQELERINTIVYNKNAEIQQLSERISKAQQSANRQGKETIEIFTIQITRLNTALCESLEQIKQLEQNIQNKNREISRVVELNKKNEQVLKDKIFQLEQENQKTLQNNHKLAANLSVLARKIQDIQRLQVDNQQMKLKLMEASSEKNKSKIAITDLQQEIQRLKNGYQNNLKQQKNSLVSKASLQLNELQEEKRQLERKIAMLVSENQQLVSQIQNLRRELEACDQQFNTNKKQLIRSKNEVANLTRQKQKYRLINEEVLKKVEKMSLHRGSDPSEKQGYQFHVKHLQAIIAEYESQIAAMKQEIEKLPNRERSRQNSSVGSSNNARNSSLGKGAGSDIQQKYNILESMHLKLKREADGLREKVAEYEFKMKKLKGQFDLITKLTHQYKDENDYLRSNNHSQCVYVGKVMQNQAVSMPSSTSQAQINGKNEDMLIKVNSDLLQQTLASQIDRLSIINANLRRQVDDLRIQATDHQSIKARYQQLMSTFVLTVVEVQALRHQRGN